MFATVDFMTPAGPNDARSQGVTGRPTLSLSEKLYRANGRDHRGVETTPSAAVAVESQCHDITWICFNHNGDRIESPSCPVAQLIATLDGKAAVDPACAHISAPEAPVCSLQFRGQGLEGHHQVVPRLRQPDRYHGIPVRPRDDRPGAPPAHVPTGFCLNFVPALPIHNGDAFGPSRDCDLVGRAHGFSDPVRHEANPNGDDSKDYYSHTARGDHDGTRPHISQTVDDPAKPSCMRCPLDPSPAKTGHEEHLGQATAPPFDAEAG